MGKLTRARYELSNILIGNAKYFDKAKNMDVIKNIKSLSVIMPVFNEETIIEKSILLLYDKLNNIAKDYEIIIVDDCSSDRTPSILETLSASIAELKVIHNDANQGLGGALRKGFSIASKELVFYTDADLPIDYEEIYRAEKILRETNSDLIAGFRYNRSAEVMYRVLYSFIYNWFIFLLFKVKIKDVNFSLKLIKRAVLEKLNLKSKGSFIDAEMIIKAAYRGYKITQIGTTYFSRKSGYSRLATPKAILKILYEMIKFYPEIAKIKKKNAKIFNR